MWSEDAIDSLDSSRQAINDQDMNFREYYKASTRLKPQRQMVKKLKPNTSVYQREFQRFIELLISVKGHAWCMDVASERRKTAKLVTTAALQFLRHRL